MRPISSLALDEEYSDTPSDGFDLDILTILELRAAAGVADGSEDAELTALGSAIGEIIGNHCNMRAAEGSVPTVRAEALVETFTMHEPCVSLVLARWPVQEVDYITEGSTVLVDGDFTLVKGKGIIRKPSATGRWSGTIEVAYVGGHPDELIPEGLKYAATALVKHLRGMAPPADRDPLVRRVSAEGIGSVDYQVETAAGASARPLVPAFIDHLLTPYKNIVI